MKICIITPLYDPWLVGGAERYATNLSNMLSEKHNVIVVTTTGKQVRTFDSKNKNPKIIEIKPRNISSLYDMLTEPSIPIVKKALWHLLDCWNISVYMHIKKILEYEKPDIVHTNGVKGLSASVFSAINASGIPQVYVAHDYELISRWSSLFRNGGPITEFNLLEKMYMRYMKTISSGVDAIISPSKFLLDIHVSRGYFKNAAKYVVPNGMDLQYNLPPKEHSQEFFYMGQLAEHKGIQVAIKAFMKMKVTDAKFHIIGDGPYFSELKAMAVGDDRIHFYGYVKDQQTINKIMSRCSYFIFPSIWYENFPLVINEVMNRGFPVIASNIGGIPELVTDGYNGFLVEPNNIEQLTTVLESVSNNQNQMTDLSRNAIKSSIAFPLKNQVESMLDIYEDHVNIDKKT